MNDHAILGTLQQGDVLNVSTTNPINGEVDVLFSVVLREEIGQSGTRLLYLSRLEHDRPMAVPIRQNPYRWDPGVGTLVDRDGDPSLELGEALLGVERGAGFDAVARYDQVPRREHVRVHASRDMLAQVQNDPVADMNNRIIQNGDVRTPMEITSLVLDQIGMPHGERELALLSAAIVQMVKMFGNPKIELVMPVVSVPVHTEQPTTPPPKTPPTSTVH